MRRRPSIGFLVVVFAGCASVAPLSPEYFVDLEKQWVAALQQPNPKFLDELLDDSFVDSTFRGEIKTKQDVLNGSRAGGAYHSIRLDDLDVRQYGGNTAVVTGVNVLQDRLGSETVRVRFTDVFCKIRGRWRAVAAQETLQTRP